MVKMATVTLSRKFQIVIPKQTRELHKLRPGDKIFLLDKGDSIELVKIGGINEAEGLFPELKGFSWKGIRDHTERFG
ncbi:MAG: AbrB/MazE/SpoVT family DNA-binding domain-containing protein [Candidatus Diapherotrites archaeon]|uniref:AbrB/MazE/SpoVT family DNA-binding domain-containing protein n=1 Tax=Candidatus Iainarchaeum sp. TaxID=3101447 RepID=A0A8T3YMF3_9ARCH|nr:AbrB/MazE/SpoVT family DNA-binding domain-containing protein [Candidatus Diapherotrites archaeon]